MRGLSDILRGMPEALFTDICALDFKFWAERMFGVVVKDFHLEFMQLAHSNRFAVIKAFRGSGKTTFLGVIYPLWLCYFRPGTHVLFTASELAQAVKILDEVKDNIENNEFLKDLMPPNPSTWKKTELKMTNGSRIFCRAYTRHIKGLHVDYCFCLHGKTFVQTSSGPKRIQDIEVGEKVLTHLGRYKEVKGVSRRHWSGKIYWLKTSAGTIKATGNHPFLIRSGTNRTRFKNADTLTPFDILLLSSSGCSPGIRYGGKILTMSNDLCKLFGLYLAEGCCSSNMVRLTFNNKETNLHEETRKIITKIFGVRTNYDKHLSHATTIYACNKYLAKKMCYWFNRYAVNKKVPSFMFKASTKHKALFAYYWLLGDGSFGMNRAYGSTSSRELADGMQRLLASIGCYSKLSEVKPGRTTFGNSCNSYHLSLAVESLNLLRALCTGKQSRRHIECKINNIEVKRCNRDVYNLLVEDDHTYLANGLVTHNCDEIQDCIDREIFNKAIAPTVNHKKGHLIATGTPNDPSDLLEELTHRPEYVARVYPVLKEAGVSRWPEKFSIEELERIRRRDGENSFQTQYMMNTNVEQEGAVFPSDWITSCFDYGEKFQDRPMEEEGIFMLGADFAVSKGARADFDSYVIVQKVSGRTVLRYGERHKGLSKDAKVSRLRELYERFKPRRMILDPSGIGEGIIQELKQFGLPVEAGEFHAKSRNKLLVNLITMIQPKKDGVTDLVIPRDPEDTRTMTFTNVLVSELLSFREVKSQATGIVSILSKGAHDDTVMSLALACKGASEQRDFLDMVL
jgi:hypothetical protein